MPPTAAVVRDVFPYSVIDKAPDALDTSTDEDAFEEASRLARGVLLGVPLGILAWGAIGFAVYSLWLAA